MKFTYLFVLLGALVLVGSIAAFIVMGRSSEEAVPVPESTEEREVPATTTEPAVFTEEGRHASVPANAEAAAPECDRGVADPGANEAQMKRGEISDFTKESVLQAILRRNALFATASAACIRTYFRTGMAVDGGDWSELEAMSDERLVTMARFMAVISREDGETDSEFRARMLGSEAQWRYEGREMKVGFEEQMENGSVTTYQSASFVNGSWY
ncbi:MAG TPA: hypothetical protein VGE23_02875 [Candidatus Paceibacterota bacterium]